MKINRLTATLVTLCLLASPTYARSEMVRGQAAGIEVGAESILNSSGDLRNQISDGLNHPRVESELVKLGIEKSEVKTRLAAMSDRELKQVAQGVERQVGGNVVVISVTTVLLIIIAILLLR